MSDIVLQGDTADERNSWLKTLLVKGVYQVTFTKISGETRTMPCTLDPAHLPPTPIKENTKTRERKTDVMSVWCTDKNEWRSFKVMNITSVKLLD